MAKTVYLHVGYGRCGSSSIQHLCARRSSALLERGLLYPAASDMGFAPEWTRGGNGRVLAQHDDPQATAGSIADYLVRSDVDRLLLSAEQLLTAGDDLLRHFADTLRARGVDVVGIVYVREQCEWLVSKWAQSLKSHGWTAPLDQFLADHAARGFTAPHLDYRIRAERLTAVFGAQHLVIRRVQPDTLRNGDVRSDIMGIIGVDADDLIAAEPRRNTSPSLEEIVLLRLGNALPDRGIFERRAFLRFTESVFAQSGWHRRRDLFRLAAPATMRVTAKHYATANEAFRRQFLPDVAPPVLTGRIPDDYKQLSEDDCLGARSVTLLADFLTRSAAGKLRRAAGAPPRESEGNAQAAPMDPTTAGLR